MRDDDLKVFATGLSGERVEIGFQRPNGAVVAKATYSAADIAHIAAHILTAATMANLKHGRNPLPAPTSPEFRYVLARPLSMDAVLTPDPQDPALQTILMSFGHAVLGVSIERESALLLADTMKTLAADHTKPAQ